MKEENVKPLLVLGMSLVLILLVALAFVAETNVVGEATKAAGDLVPGDVILSGTQQYKVITATPTPYSMKYEYQKCNNNDCDYPVGDLLDVEVSPGLQIVMFSSVDDTEPVVEETVTAPATTEPVVETTTIEYEGDAPDPYDSAEQATADLFFNNGGYIYNSAGFFTDGSSSTQYWILPDGDVFKVDSSGSETTYSLLNYPSNLDGKWSELDSLPDDFLVLAASTMADEDIRSYVGDSDSEISNQLLATTEDGATLTYNNEGTSMSEFIEKQLSDATENPHLYTVKVTLDGKNQEVRLYEGQYYLASDFEEDKLKEGAKRLVLTDGEDKSYTISVTRNGGPRIIPPSEVTAETGYSFDELGYPVEITRSLFADYTITNEDSRGEGNFVLEKKNSDGSKTVMVKDSTGDEMYYYIDSEKIDEKQVVHFGNGKFVLDSDNALDSETGLCAGNEWTCMGSTDNTGLRAGAQYAPSQTVDNAASIIIKNGDTVREITVTSTTHWPNEKLKIFPVEVGYKNVYKNGDSDINGEGGQAITDADSGKVYHFGPNGKQKYYSWEGDGSREYYQQGESYFGYSEVSAVAADDVCTGAKLDCGGEILYINEGTVTASGTSDDAGYYLVEDLNGDGYISGAELEEGERAKDAAGNDIKLSNSDYSVLTDYCGSTENTCYTKGENTAKKASLIDILHGDSQVQKIGSSGIQILGTFNEYSGISMALGGGDYLYGGELVADMDRWFAGTVLSEEYWESKFCTAEFQDLWDSPGVQYIQTPSGTLQAVSSIHASHSQKQPILCSQDAEDTESECPEDYSCENDFCVDNDGEIAMGYLYSISWAVAAPADEAQTPYIDENGIAVNFNIVIDANADEEVKDPLVELYSYNGNTNNPLQLVNGDRDSANIYHWSLADEDGEPKYFEACIRWGSNGAPVTIANPAMRRSDEGAETYKGGVLMPDNCDEINEIIQGSVTLIDESMSGSSSSIESATSVTSGDGEISYDSSW